MNEMLEMPATILRPTQKRILLVDDYPAVRRMLARLLAVEGYQVEVGLLGMEEIEKIDPAIDLVLMDVNRPFKEEWTIFQQLCAHCPSLPVILITAAPRGYFLKSPVGMGAWLEKPLDFVKLFDTIHGFLEGQRTGWRTRAADPPLLKSAQPNH